MWTTKFLTKSKPRVCDELSGSRSVVLVLHMSAKLASGVRLMTVMTRRMLWDDEWNESPCGTLQEPDPSHCFVFYFFSIVVSFCEEQHMVISYMGDFIITMLFVDKKYKLTLHSVVVYTLLCQSRKFYFKLIRFLVLFQNVVYLRFLTIKDIKLS